MPLYKTLSRLPVTTVGMDQLAKLTTNLDAGTRISPICLCFIRVVTLAWFVLLFDLLSAMACLEAAPWPSLLPHCLHWPPLHRGVLTSFDFGFVIAADSQEDDYYVHEGP